MLKKSINLKVLFPIVIFLHGCSSQYTSIPPSNTIDKIDIKISDKVGGRFLVNNPYGHQYEYTYTADRGQIIANNSNGVTYLYYAPFTGGPDTIRVSIFDRTDNVNLPIRSEQVFVQGESMSYVDLSSNTSGVLGNTENGKIKLASVRGATTKKDIGLGRSPVISPDGKYIAYVKYSDNGTSKIVVQDPIGKEKDLIDDGSINKDPSWSPIGTDGNLYLVFSSNRNVNNTNPNKKFHLWSIHVNGYDLRQLTKGDCNNMQPNWSPNGKSIVFISNLNEETKAETDVYNLYTLDVETQKRKQLTEEDKTGYGVRHPIWSPDAQRIAYTKRYQKKELEKVNNLQKIWINDTVQNTKKSNLSLTQEDDSSLIESFPSWSPDGRSITFIQQKDKENKLLSLELSTLNSESGNKSPTQESDLKNVAEASWSRQRSYGYSYGNTPTNPFTPGSGY